MVSWWLILSLLGLLNWRETEDLPCSPSRTPSVQVFNSTSTTVGYKGQYTFARVKWMLYAIGATASWSSPQPSVTPPSNPSLLLGTNVSRWNTGSTSSAGRQTNNRPFGILQEPCLSPSVGWVTDLASLSLDVFLEWDSDGLLFKDPL